MSSQSDVSPMENQPSEDHSLTVQGSKPIGNVGSTTVEWAAVSPTENNLQKGVTPTAYVHALRRHWLLSGAMGVILAGIVAVLLWVLLPKTYTTSSLIKVAMQSDSIVGDERARVYAPLYEVEKGTQLGLVRSPFVLQAALRAPGISNLSIVKKRKNDIITWLKEELRVSYPGNAELMEISLSGDSPSEVTKLVQAITDAYWKESVEKEEDRRRAKLAELERCYSQQSEKVRKARSSLSALAETMKTSDREAVSIQQQAAVQRLGESRRQLYTVRRELRQLRGQLVAQQKAFERLNEIQGDDFEVQEAIQRDPIMRQLLQKESGYREMVAQQERVVRPGSTSLSADRFSRQFQSITAECESRRTEIREMIQKAKQAKLKEMLADLQVRVDVLAREEKVLDGEYLEQREEVNQIGKSSVELEMKQKDLETYEGMLRQLAGGRETLKIELSSKPRIQLLQKATDPKTYDNPKIRMALTLLGSGIGFFIPVCGLVWWDVRKQRINTPDEVSKDLGLNVIGSVPIIPGRAIGRLNAPGRKNQLWNLRLTESIDGIAARLLRNAAIEESRVVLVTSAVSGEGKTTLATQIAMSLARAGKNTALVDFDLRRPSIDKAFQLPLDPGVSEVLCQEATVADVVQPIDFPNLSVVTSGRCDRLALQALANGGDALIFEELRKEFDFVIVDGSPILPVADSRYVAQHVDKVVMSVFRDFSRAPRVTSACEILNAFGVEELEAVVISSGEDSYGTIDADVGA